MGKFKIALIGLFSYLGLLSCYTLNSNILDDQEYSLEPQDNQEDLPARRIISAQFDDDAVTLVLQRENGPNIMANLQDVIPMETRRDKRESTPDIDFDYDYDDTEDSPNFEEMFPKLDSDLLFELDLPSPPPKIVLCLNVYLDKNWLQLFGSIGTEIATKRILDQASLLLAHDSLDTKIELVYDADKFHHSSQHLVPNKKTYNNLLPEELIGPDYDDEGKPTAHLFLSAATRESRPHSVGISQMYGMCTGNETQRPRVIVHAQESELRTAMTVAHELGHLLGMEHDFIPGRRNRTCGEKTGETMMNYGSNRQTFSECSNIDFKDYFERVVARNGEFCLKHAAEGCSCNGRKDNRGLGGKCADGPRGQWCYVYQDSGCDDLEEYAGKHISFLSCMTVNNTTTVLAVEETNSKAGRNLNPGIFLNIWSDEQCLNIGFGPRNGNLEDCKKSCLEKPSCTAINFNSWDRVHRGCSIPVPAPEWEYGQANGYKGYIVRNEPFSKMWSDNQCSHVGFGPRNGNLEDCKKSCQEKPNCNAINFNPLDCVHRGCSRPISSPEIEYGYGYEGYIVL